MNGLSDRQVAILRGILGACLDDAARDGRTGDWVDMVREIFDIASATPSSRSKVNPTAGEPFGTPVTYWSQSWGNRHAVITRSPRLADERGRFDSADYQIMIKDSGMTHVPASMLTFGWHPDADS